VSREVLKPASIVGQTLALSEAQGVLEAMDKFETLGFSVITEF
jgi:hypothetical protein